MANLKSFYLATSFGIRFEEGRRGLEAVKLSFLDSQETCLPRGEPRIGCPEGHPQVQLLGPSQHRWVGLRCPDPLPGAGLGAGSETGVERVAVEVKCKGG